MFFLWPRNLHIKCMCEKKRRSLSLYYFFFDWLLFWFDCFVIVLRVLITWELLGFRYNVVSSFAVFFCCCSYTMLFFFYLSFVLCRIVSFIEFWHRSEEEILERREAKEKIKVLSRVIIVAGAWKMKKKKTWLSFGYVSKTKKKRKKWS
jgi:hypothetical protein